MYKGWTTKITEIQTAVDNDGVLTVTFEFTKGKQVETYTERMSKIDRKIARDYIDSLEVPNEQAQSQANAQKAIDDQKSYVSLMVANSPLGYFDLSI